MADNPKMEDPREVAVDTPGEPLTADRPGALEDPQVLQGIHARYASKVWRTWALLAPLLLIVPALAARAAAHHWGFGVLVTLIWWLAWLPITAGLGTGLLVRPRLRRLARQFANELEAKGWSAADTVPTLAAGPERDALLQLLAPPEGRKPLSTPNRR